MSSKSSHTWKMRAHELSRKTRSVSTTCLATLWQTWWLRRRLKRSLTRLYYCCCCCCCCVCVVFVLLCVVVCCCVLCGFGCGCCFCLDTRSREAMCISIQQHGRCKIDDSFSCGRTPGSQTPGIPATSSLRQPTTVGHRGLALGLNVGKDGARKCRKNMSKKGRRPSEAIRRQLQDPDRRKCVNFFQLTHEELWARHLSCKGPRDKREDKKKVQQ